MRTLLRLALTAALAAPLAHAQTELLWRTQADGATTVETAPDGTVTVGGSGGVTRLAPDGSVLWAVPSPGGDALVDLALGPDGEVYALASISNPAPTRIDLLVYRIDADGTLAWNHSYDGPTSGESLIDEWDQPKAIVVTSTGTVVTVAVSGLAGHPLQTVWTQGYGTNGTPLWSQSIPRTGGELQSLRATRAATDCAGNVFVVGSYDVINSPTASNDPGYLLSYASDGTERFMTRLFGREVAEPGEASVVNLNEVAADCATGAVYVAGQDYSAVRDDAGNPTAHRDAFVARYDGAGQAWQAFPFGAYSGQGNSSSSGVQNLAVSASGAIYASAEAAETQDNTDRVEVARLADDGARMWLQTLTGTNIRIKQSTVASAEGVTVVTSTTTPSTTHYDHFDPFGVQDWTFDRSAESEGSAANRTESMAAHPDGGVVWLETVRYGPTHVVRVGERVPTARIVLVHAAAALAVIGPIEVYVDQPAESTTPDAVVSFRNGTPSLTIPAGVPFEVRLRAVTPPPGLPESFTFTAPGVAPGLYVTSLMGMFEMMVPLFRSNPDGRSLLLQLRVAFIRELLDGSARLGGGVPVVVTNAVTDAPAVDVVVAETGEVLADDLPYGESAPVTSLAAGTYRIEVRRASDQSVLEAVLFKLDGTEEAVALTASGFLDPTANQNGPALTLTATDETGTTDTGVVVTATDEAPVAGLALTGPNPTRAGGAVQYTVPAGRVRLAVVDLLGREVAVLAEGERAGGTYAAVLPALAPGLYVLRLEASGAAVSRRVAVVR